MPNAASHKKPFDIDVVMQRLRNAVREVPDAALFELAGEGFASPYEQLIACIISIRTRDETTLPASRRLFERARTPGQMVQLTPGQVDKIIGASTFHERKARQILDLSQQILDNYHGDLPCDVDVLTSFSGVGIKCAHLVLGIACGQPRVSADVHVHRVTNRWGYIETRTPEATSLALEEKLPRPYWVEINRRLVPFGKHICTRRLPHCSTCPILEMCRQVGVDAHR